MTTSETMRSATTPTNAASPASSATGDGTTLLARALMRQETTLILVAVAIGCAASFRSDLFLTTANVTEIFRSSVIYFVLGCGAALLIIGGGLDFSAGAVFTLGSLTVSKLLVSGTPWPIAVVVALAACCLVGIVNFATITYLHVWPIIATLGTFYILTGIDNLITDGNDVLPLPADFQKLGQGKIAGVPNIVLLAIAVGLGFWFVLERTRFGVNVRALGGNRAAAAANGLRVVRIDMALYSIAAATAALAGMIYSARVGAGQVTAGGTAVTLTSITAVLIGGVSLMGGMGSIQGVAVGAVLLSLINNALVLARIPPQYNTIVVGSILICAVAVDHLRRARIYRKR